VSDTPGFNPQNFAQILQDLGQLLASSSADPINWPGAVQVAKRSINQLPSVPVSQSEREAAISAGITADLWLADATDLPSHATAVEVWSPEDWVDGTLDEWRDLVNPIAERVSQALTQILPRIAEISGDDPTEDQQQLGAAFAPLAAMMKPLSSAMFGMQVGNGLAGLASEVLCSTEIGLPLTQGHTPALVLPNILKFGSELGEAGKDALVFVAMREAAHQRLFAATPWLVSQFQTSIVEYSRTIGVDVDRLREIVQSIEMNSGENMQEILGQGLVNEMTPKADSPALNRLETLLALIEGWVNQVVTAAAASRLPSAAALSETLRRRRAVGGPAERTFMTLMGLQLRPGRLKQANQYWDLMLERKGVSKRDEVWSHPDLLPSTEDLKDPDAYIASQ
jgi:putative hydrolase